MRRGRLQRRLVSTTVVLTSYNQREVLPLVLQALARQSVRLDELILADDGSRDDSLAIVRSGAREHGLPLAAVLTQDDLGFRKATILNAAIRASRGQQLVFLDGDVLPGRDWLCAHRSRFRTGTYVVGSYARLSGPESRLFRPDNVGQQLDGLCRHAGHDRWFRRHDLKARWYALTRKFNRPLLHGGNFSVDRGVLFGVNGFDEQFNGFGGEDSDLRCRMNLYGARPISAIRAAKAFHLEPEPAAGDRPSAIADRRPYSESPYQALKATRVWAELGLTRHPVPVDAANQDEAG